MEALEIVVGAALDKIRAQEAKIAGLEAHIQGLYGVLARVVENDPDVSVFP